MYRGFVCCNGLRKTAKIGVKLQVYNSKNHVSVEQMLTLRGFFPALTSSYHRKPLLMNSVSVGFRFTKSKIADAMVQSVKR